MTEQTEPTLDVREFIPMMRHPKIFELFDALQSGEAVVLVNDHDPKPLYYQLLHERPGEFAWDYLEDGPDVWRVRIAKVVPG